jgi:DNA polymerase I-like protein with 3'-5' exonuclease and polymerase domains
MQKVDKSIFKYTPAEAPAPLDVRFQNRLPDGTWRYNVDFKLVESVEELEEFKNKHLGKSIAFDTETTGLSYGKDHIVGFSLSVDSYSGIYVPIRHKIKQEVNKVMVDVTDGEGNILLTPTGRPRRKTVREYIYHDSAYNLDPKKCLDILYDILKESSSVYIHNAEYDCIMLRQESPNYDIKQISFLDTMVLAYLVDAEARGYFGLKPAEKHYCGRFRPDFDETLGGADNFQYVCPQDAYFYACADTASTYKLKEALVPKIRNLLKKHKETIVLDGSKYNVVQADNKLIKAWADYYAHVELKVDKEVAREYKELVKEKLEVLSQDIYGYFNKGVFSLSPSANAFKDAMREFNIHTGEYTETGNVSYGKDGIKTFNKNIKDLKDILNDFDKIRFTDSELDLRSSSMGLALSKILNTFANPYFTLIPRPNSLGVLTKTKDSLTRDEFYDKLQVMVILETKKLEVLKKIQQNSSLQKAMNSYISKLSEVDSCRMRYKLFGTKSGRLSSGNGSKNDKKFKNHYYIDLNAQNLTKPKSAFYKAVKRESEKSILGWDFEMVTDEYAMANKDTEVIVEGSSPELNIRNCVVAPEGKYILSFDYSSQEALLIALLSKDTRMIRNFMEGIDPHTATAIAIWGEAAYNKSLRKLAKACLGENSYVATQRGLIRPRDLKKEDKLIDRYGNFQNYIMEVEDGDTIELEYSSGIIEEYRPDHKVLVWSGSDFIWKTVTELTSGDNVVQMTGHHSIDNSDKTLELKKPVLGVCSSKTGSIDIRSKDFAYIVGMYVAGGGYITGLTPPYSLALEVPKKIRVKVIKKFRSLGLVAKSPPDISKGLKTSKVIVDNNSLCNFLRENFGVLEEERNIPEWIYTTWDKEALLNFVAGFADFSQGGKEGYAVKVLNSNKEILNKMSIACSLAGIKTSLSQKECKEIPSKSIVYSLLMYYFNAPLPSLTFNIDVKKDPRVVWNSWDIDLEYFDDICESQVYNSDKSYRLKKRCSFILDGRTGLSSDTIGLMEGEGIDFPIKSNMQVAKVVSKTEKKGNIYVIQTDTHEYISNCIISHNCNFAIQYGGTGYTIANSAEIPLKDAEEIYNRYLEAFFEATQWKKDQVRKTYERGGTVYTMFGRPRRLGSYIESSESQDNMGNNSASFKLDALVARAVISHLIQGACGDMCRYVLQKLYDNIFSIPEKEKECSFLSTVHDEVNYVVLKEKTVEYSREIEDIMTFQIPSAPLPIKVSIDVGNRWGECFPFEWSSDDRTELVPQRI